jgi:hypothetical protein
MDGAEAFFTILQQFHKYNSETNYLKIALQMIIKELCEMYFSKMLKDIAFSLL